MKKGTVIFGRSPSGGKMLGDRPIIAVAGDGSPMPRTVNQKQKAKNRRRRKLAKASRQ
jgi:hypothetical protein